VPCLRAWADSLGGINYPLLSDFWPHGETADCYGVLRPEDGFSERAIFVIDAGGVIRYIDIHDITDQPDNEEVRKVLRQIEGTREEAGLRLSQVDLPSSLVEAPKNTGEVILYCAKWCRDCVKVKAWMEQRGLEYVEVDIDYDEEARAQVRQWCGGKLITPVIDFYGTIVIDYNVPRLEEALRSRGR
jgi:glutaredoxin